MATTILMEAAPKPKGSLSPIPLKIYINSKVTDPIWPEFELIWDFMPVLVTSEFDKDPIKNEQASLEILFSLIICKFENDRIKNNREKVETLFSPL